MTDSLTPRQRDEVEQLGRWRDDGHRLAVGLDGKVSIHPADKGDYHVATEQREGAARRQGPSGRQGAAGSSGAAAPSESARKDGGEDLRQQYLLAMPEVREFYPDLRVIDLEDGIWVVTQIFPIGRDGPTFTVCLYLPLSKAFDPLAYAFVGNGRRGVPVGLRHTNFPDASVCSHSADDAAWKPGDPPLVLLNLCAEWLVCHLFFAVWEYWPGPQSGMSAAYRQMEFKAVEWCDCGSKRRYGDCHSMADAKEVQRLQLIGQYESLPDRAVPDAIVSFARSGWKTVPRTLNRPLRPFVSREAALLRRMKERLR